jgi:RNA polymerase sigma factor (TIGR02999 family)
MPRCGVWRGIPTHPGAPRLLSLRATSPKEGIFRRDSTRGSGGAQCYNPGQSQFHQAAEGCQNMPSNPDVTMLLQAWRGGDSQALERLVPLVRTEIHRLAGRYMKRERPGHVLQTTALVNEAYLRLIDWKGVSWQNRAHFLGVAAQLMRHILVDFARKRPLSEGEQEAVHVSLDEARLLAPEKSAEVIAVDDALKALATFDPRKSQIVELRYFGGLSVEETAEVLGLAPITVIREWNKAKAWLYRELSRTVASGE